MPGSVVSTRSSFCAGQVGAVGDAHHARRGSSGRCRRRRRGGCSPTSRPLAVLTSALSSGQSAIASEPSAIASVSRYGEATEPESRWSRPITIGADSSPAAHHLVEAQPEPVALAVAEPADARRAAPGRRPARRPGAIQRARPLVVGELLEHGAVGGGDVGRIAGQRHPAERALALAEQRPDVGGQEAGVVERPLEAAELAPRRAGCCRSRTPRRPRRGSRPSPRSARPSSRGPGGRSSSGSSGAQLGVGLRRARSAGHVADSGSWALVWSVTMSAGKSGASSARQRRRRRCRQADRQRAALVAWPRRQRATRVVESSRPSRRGSGSRAGAAMRSGRRRCTARRRRSS